MLSIPAAFILFPSSSGVSKIFILALKELHSLKYMDLQLAWCFSTGFRRILGILKNRLLQFSMASDFPSGNSQKWIIAHVGGAVEFAQDIYTEHLILGLT